MMTHLNEASVLHSLRQRYALDDLCEPGTEEGPRVGGAVRGGGGAVASRAGLGQKAAARQRSGPWGGGRGAVCGGAAGLEVG